MIFNVTNKTLAPETIDFMNNIILKMPTFLLIKFKDEILFNLHGCDEVLLEQLMWTVNRIDAEITQRGGNG